MWKNARLAAAAAVCLVGPAWAAEGSRLSIPDLQAKPAADVSVANGPAILRSARIGIVEDPNGPEQSPKKTGDRESSSPPRPTPIKTSPPKQLTTRAPKEKRPPTSSRRTASPSLADSADQKIAFRPVEVMPLKEDSRRAAELQPAPVGEVQYPVLPSDSLASEATAEYEEDAAGVAAERQENLAPIVSAADLPRPGRVRPTAATESGAPSDLSLPPIAPQTANPEMRQDRKQPRTLSSILRLPEFRARPAKQAE